MPAQNSIRIRRIEKKRCDIGIREPVERYYNWPGGILFAFRGRCNHKYRPIRVFPSHFMYKQTSPLDQNYSKKNKTFSYQVSVL